ncbi:MAG: hypothetical protein U0V02_04375 [Anaerolineales bacterium]
MNSSFPQPKPGLITAIAVMTLTSGIINLFWGFVASATALGTIVGAICLPITILPTILGVFEIIYAAKLLSTQPQPVKPSQPIAFFEIATVVMGNVFSMVVGILVLIFYNDLTVKEYFSNLNAQSVPVASVPVPAIIEPTVEEPDIEELPVPQEIEPPKPKRKSDPRKVA